MPPDLIFTAASRSQPLAERAQAVIVLRGFKTLKEICALVGADGGPAFTESGVSALSWATRSWSASFR
jgi:hypothetical protein